MGHGHGHHTSKNYNNAFAFGIGLNLLFVGVEVFYGLLANSSALLADAGHNASDVLGLVFAWLAIWLAGRKPKGRYSYGFKKSTILVTVLNAILLFIAVAFIAADAVDKFKNPQPVAGSLIMTVAAIGVVINTITALLFIRGQKNDLNIKGAFLHMAADAAVSLGVVVGGLLISKTGYNWIDPIMSLIIIVVIVWGTLKLFIDSVNLALDAVPRHINIDKVRTYILALNEVHSIHDFHIWGISTTEVALTAHIYVPDSIPDNFLSNLDDKLHHEFGISHTTFQIENKAMEDNCNIDC